jgi:FlaA1/EpsC-like NDP-sugar epimerase
VESTWQPWPVASALGRLRRTARPSFLAVADVAGVLAAYATALLLRYDATPSPALLAATLRLGLAAAVVTLLVFTVAGLYRRLWRQAAINDVWDLLVAVVASGIVVVAADALVPHRSVSLSVPLMAGVIAAVPLGAVRLHARLRPSRGSAAGDHGLLLVGPVDAVRPLLEQLRSDPDATARPVAVVTAVPQDWGRTLAGIPVVGPPSDLCRFVDRFGATRVLVADGAQTPHLQELGNVRVSTVPTVREVLARRPRARHGNDDLESLLGRQPATPDLTVVRQAITGQRVLITGAGGSIGSEIAAQVARLDPSELVLLDHDETHLHEACLGLPDGAQPCLGDVRDAEFLSRLLHRHRPDVIFHAAAHKHVPILESHPVEAVRTNVHGTHVLLDAADRAGVPRVVAISTDKAVDPSSVMGASKRLAEDLVVSYSGPGRQYCAVRFGNVLGSRGSVVPTFARQIQSGGPVTLTHPDMTRYLMSIREAVTLVLEAAAMADGGELFLLDMGEPIRILDLAHSMIRHAGLRPGTDIEVVTTGLRPGEKMHERLHSSDEEITPTQHDRVRRVLRSAPPAASLRTRIEALEHLAWQGDEQGTRDLLFRAVRGELVT